MKQENKETKKILKEFGIKGKNKKLSFFGIIGLITAYLLSILLLLFVIWLISLLISAIF